MRSSYADPKREEFLRMLQVCGEDQYAEGLAGDDARLYLKSNRCLELCRQYLTKTTPGTPEGGARA